MIRFSLIALCLSIFIFAATPSMAMGNSNGMSEEIKNVFSDVEKELIKEYFDVSGNKKKAKGLFGDHYNDKYKGKDKGKNKHKGKSKNFPPGLAKKDALPPGLHKRDLPYDLHSRLPKLREGIRRMIIGDDILLIEEGTEIIMDILQDVLL